PRHLQRIAASRPQGTDTFCVGQFDLLIADPTANTESIATRDGCSVRKVNMTISLAFLAPDLVKAAIEGRLPHGMGVVRLADLLPNGARQLRPIWQRRQAGARVGKRAARSARSLLSDLQHATAQSGRNRLAVSRLPAPGAGAVAALDYALLVNLRDDLAVAGEQRLGRAHFRAERQFAFRQTVGAVLLELGERVVRLRPARAVGALVHLAARAEIAGFRILRRAERARVEAIAAADAQVLGVQHHAIGGGVEAVHRTHRRAGRIGAVHAGHGHRALA